MLSPITVFEMEPDMVTCIAGETKEYRSLREQLGKKLDILGRGLETCKRFVGIRGIGKHLKACILTSYLYSYDQGLVAESKLVSEGNGSQKVVQSTTAMTIDEPNEITLQHPQTPPNYVTEIQLTPIESPAHDCNPLTLQEDQNVANSVPERSQDAQYVYRGDEVTYAADKPADVDTFDGQSTQSVWSPSVKKSRKGKKVKKKTPASMDMDRDMEPMDKPLDAWMDG